MKKSIQFAIVLFLLPMVLIAQNITVAYENAVITNDGVDDFYEVDVFLSSDTDFILGEGQFLWDYNTAAFGENIFTNGNLEYLRPANSILGSQTFTVDNYSGFVANDQVADRTGFAWTQFWSGGTIGDNVSAIPELLLRIKIKYVNLAEDPNVCFNTVSPRDDQFKTACGPFAPGPAAADCNNEDGTFILDYMPECDGALLPVELCTGGTTTFTTALSWDNGEPDQTMTAIIEGNYNTLVFGNIEACELIITSTGQLFIASTGDDYVRVQNDIENEGELIVGHRASLVQVNDEAVVDNTGNIEVLVTTAEVETRDFVMLGSPMDLETREDVLANAFNVQTFVPGLFVPFEPQEIGVVYNFQSTTLDVWDPQSGLLNVGEGYLVFPQDDYNGSGGTFDYVFNEGTLNNGIYTKTLTYNGTQEGSPNMLSNPYASAIDADQFFIENPTIDTVYFWEHGTAASTAIPGPDDKNFSMRDVSAYNSTGGIMAASGAGTMPNGVISTAQGFGVFAPSATNVVFNNSMRLTTGNTTLRTNEIQKDRLWLRVEDLTYREGANTLIGFLNGATEGYEARYDSPVIENVVSLYSYIEDDFTTGYSIQGRESFTENATVKIGFNSLIDTPSTYRISLSDFDGIAWEENEVFLTDNATGVITNLSKTYYEFSAIGGHYENRFLLSFKNNNVLATDSFDRNIISLYPNPAIQTLHFASSEAIIERITIFDIKGRMILQKNLINETATQIEVSTLQSGIYMATISTESGETNKRFIKK